MKTVGSLFSGVGGIDLAFERQGFHTAYQSEVDHHASAVLRHHWPLVPNLGDVNHVRSVPRTDVIVGGFPCQSYSVAGKRRGLADDRGELWWRMHAIIGAALPEWVVGENVVGLLSANGGRDFATILGSLVDLGYGVTYRVLDSQFFGVPQRRRRVIVVGHLGGEPRPEVLDLAQGRAGDPPPERKETEVVAALTRSGLGGGGVDDNLAQAGHVIASNGQDITGTVTTTWSKGPGNTQVEEGHVVLPFAENQRGELRYTETVPSLSKGGGKPGSGYPAALVRGRPRRLTPIECERLQGFPDNWTAMCSDTQRYRQMGNAVTVPVFEWVAKRIKEMTDE